MESYITWQNRKSDFPVISANILLAKSSYWFLLYSEMGIIKKCDLAEVRGHCNLSQPHLKIIKSYIKTLILNFANILITIVEHITFTYLKKSQTYLLWRLNLISLFNNNKLLPSYGYFSAFISVRCLHYFKENGQNTALHLAFFSIYIHFVCFEILCRNCTQSLWMHTVLSSTSAFQPCVILLLLWIRLRVFYSFRVYYRCPDSCFRFFLFYLALNWQQEWCGVWQRPFQLCLEQWS